MKDHAPRILAGELKGRRIHVPRGRETRPLRALLRKSLFDRIADLLPESSFLDLFAGAGTVGFEALSRGAASVTFVDSGRAACQAMRRSAAALGVEERVRIVSCDASTYLSRSTAAFDLLYAGPPYPLYREGRRAALDEDLDRLQGVLKPGGTAIVEAPAYALAPRPRGLSPAGERRSSDTVLFFFVAEPGRADEKGR